MYSNNSIFSSGLSSSNPFGGYGQPNSTTSPALADAYAKLELLKQQQMASQQNNMQKSTVFTDIAAEMKDVSDDELNYIISAPEYQQLNTKYQNEFSEFLIAKFANEYLQVGNQRTLEEMLGIIRKRKEQYKGKFAEDISEIREQNKSLLDRNNQLADSNKKLQEQLQEIQNKIWGGQ